MIVPEAWTPVDDFALEPNAIEAATASGKSVVVTAGPGAGKTELLAQRADFLLRTGLCPYPRRILAISFKVDAARNLRSRVLARSGHQVAARLDSFTFHAFAKRLIDNFRPALTGHNALDADFTIDPDNRVARKQIRFDDLVPLALEIVQSNRYARGGVRQTYSHVFLDEFQDCTREQYALVKELFVGSGVELTAVGDTKQRIMAWAGALEGIMAAFALDFEAQPLPLYQNFRSAPRLRRMQNRMVEAMDPAAVSSDAELVGDEGEIDTLLFETDVDEADHVADVVDAWLAAGVPASEIAVLVRQQPHLVAAALGRALTVRGIPYRNEQEYQDFAAEPVVALIFDFIRVVAGNREPVAHGNLIRLVTRQSASEEDSQRFFQRFDRFLRDVRTRVRSPEFEESDPGNWGEPVQAFLDVVSRPVLVALSPSYERGRRLDDLIVRAVEEFGVQLRATGQPRLALQRLSDLDAVRVLTVHKAKGLEFEKVVVLGVETQLFWGGSDMSEFFVAISRAKHHLLLTVANYRARPSGFERRWDEWRAPHMDLLGFARE